MNTATIYTDQAAPGGRTIRYNLDQSTRAVAQTVKDCLLNGELVEIPNEAGGEPIFLNPERVASITPGREE